MSAIPEPIVSSRGEPPACLFSENPSGLVSLWGLMRFYAEKFVSMSGFLNKIGAMLMHPEASLREPSLTHLKERVQRCIDLCVEFDLPMARKKLEELLSDLNLHSLDWPLEQRRTFEECSSRIHDELQDRVFIAASKGYAAYYDMAAPPFGKVVFDAFPSANDDISEAGNCLAVYRNTATVFHSMRVVEVGLRALATELGIPYAPSWEAYIRQLKTIIEADWKSKPADMRLKQPFYKDVLGDIEAIKLAWRNPTMHVARSYGPQEAERIYIAVKHLMARLADFGLRE
jgi:hypothetical protein